MGMSWRLPETRLSVMLSEIRCRAKKFHSASLYPSKIRSFCKISPVSGNSVTLNSNHPAPTAIRAPRSAGVPAHVPWLRERTAPHAPSHSHLIGPRQECRGSEFFHSASLELSKTCKICQIPAVTGKSAALNPTHPAPAAIRAPIRSVDLTFHDANGPSLSCKCPPAGLVPAQPKGVAGPRVSRHSRTWTANKPRRTRLPFLIPLTPASGPVRPASTLTPNIA